MRRTPRDSASGLPAWLLTLARARYVLLLLAGVLPGLWHVHSSGGVGDWAYFRAGALVLTGQTDLPPGQLYLDSPDTQIGPPALLLALPVALLPAAVSTWTIVVLLGAALPLCCYLLERASGERAADPRTGLTVLAGGLFAALYWWRVSADFTHPDDVLAVLAACLVLCWFRTRSEPWTPWVAAVVLGTAAAGKPWAIGFLPLVAAWSGPLVLRAARLAVGGLVAAAWWAPFLLAAPGTLSALGTFRVDVWYSSPLTLLGLAGEPYPAWVRPAQFALTIALACVAVARRRAHLVPFAVAAGRIAVDPQAWDYYFATVAIACLAVDLLRTRYRGPWLTLAVVFVLYDARWLADFELAAAFQVLPLLVACAALATDLRPGRRTARSLTPTRSRSWGAA
ncbi:hypothetical protein [Kineococcus sp. SYSU DK003]|uniref:hypothetical protein n=1 Tax=Kineococcus sp. SYSU DK003 TaxID=3383124 RepID=UPI003D7CDB9B